MTTDLVNGAVVRSVPWVDRFAISLSALCILHCLFLPILIVFLPSLGNSFISSEAMHLGLVYTVIPSSLFALGLGCKQHRRGLFMLLGIIGVSLLALGIVVELIGVGPVWERLFTFAGALLIAYAHIRNFRQCRKSSDSSCHKRGVK